MNLIFLLCFALVVAPLRAADEEHIVILRDETQYYITPWLTRLQNGDLIVTAREAHRRRREYISHTDPTARGVLVRSRDGGRTWADKIVIDDETYRFSQTEDVPATQLRDGTLLLNLYSWALSPLPAGYVTTLGERPYSATFEGISLLRSSDNGRTWSPRQPLRVPDLPKLHARVPALELPDGTLLLAVAGHSSEAVPYKSWVIRSRDGGRTWGEPAPLAADPEGKRMFAEPCLLRKRGGGLIAMMRTGGYLYQSDSTDDGRTWSEPKPTRMWGWPAHLMQLRDGRILCTYGHRRAPFGLRASLSRDGGLSWDVANEIVLRDDGGNGDLGYPSAVEFPDGRVLTIYWMNHERPGDPASEVRYIGGTFYRP